MMPRHSRRGRRERRPQRIHALALSRRLTLFALAALGTLFLWPAEVGAEPGITLIDYPQELVGEEEDVTVTWVEPLLCHMRYGQVPGSYPHSTTATGVQSLSFRPLDEGMTSGIYYCVIERVSTRIETSEEFVLIVESPEAPTPVAPGNGTVINETTTLLEWDPVGGVPYYHVVVSDAPLELGEDANGDLTVQGANIIWQAITSGTSIQYGSVDPSGHFTEANGSSPPLMNQLEYNWIVLNNYGNHPLLTSLAGAGLAGFTISVPVGVASPIQVSPADGALVASDDLTFEWTAVPDAVGYHLYIYHVREFAGSDAGYPIWDGGTNGVDLQVALSIVFVTGDYRWRVVAFDDQGRGAPSDLRTFTYDTSIGTAVITTETSEGNVLPWVQIDIEYLAGGVTLPPSLTDGEGKCDRKLPPGTYLFTATKNYYGTGIAEATIGPGQDTSVLFQLTRAPAKIRGVVEDELGQPVFNADVAAVGPQGEVWEISDQNGNFQVNLGAGTWEVYAKKGGYVHSASQFVDVASYETVDLEGPLVLTGEPGTLTGNVLNAAGSPIAGATVWADGPNESFAATTTSSGHFSIELAPGPWMIWAEKSGFQPSSPREVEMPAGEAVTLAPPIVLSPVAATIAGTVTDGEENYAGALVVAIPPTGAVETTYTDSYGQFTLIPSASIYFLKAFVEGIGSSQAHQVTVDAGESVTGLALVIEPRDGLITGFVTDGNDPIEGAVVTDGEADVLTGPDGWFSLAVKRGLHELVATKNGYFPEEPLVIATAPGQLIDSLAIRITPGAGSISGAVTHDGAQVPYARVTAATNGQAVSTWADQAGGYALSVDAGEWSVTAIKEPLGASESATVLLGPGQSAGGVDLEVISTWATVEGTVTDGRADVRQAEILIFREGETRPAYRTISSANGTYRVHVASGEAYTLEARADDHGCASVSVEPLDVGGLLTEHVTLEEYTASLEGDVADGSGNPVDDVLVVSSWGDSAWVRTGRTGKSGWYKLPTEVGQSDVRFTLPGYETATIPAVQVNPDEVTTLNVQLNELFASLEGTIRDSVTGEALENAVITIESQGRAASYATGKSGWYDVDEIVPGVADVRITLSGYKSGWMNVELGELENQLLDIDLIPLMGTIAGRVSDPLAAGIEGASVRAKLDESVVSSATTDEDGDYVLLGLDAEELYDISASKEGYFSASTNPLEDVPALSSGIDFSMVQADGTITGYVRDAVSGDPLVGASVTANDGAGHFGETASEADGAFSLENMVPLGDYDVSATFDGYFLAAVEDVAIGTTDLILNLPRNFARVAGTVTLIGLGIVMEEIEVVATSTAYAGDTKTATPDETGGYEITDVRPGTYVLSVSADRCLSTPTQISLVLEDGESVTDQNFLVERAMIDHIEIEGSTLVQTGMQATFTGNAIAQGDRLVDVDLEWWISPRMAGTIDSETGTFTCEPDYFGELTIAAREPESGVIGRLESGVFTIIDETTQATFSDSCGMTLTIEPGAVQEQQLIMLTHEEVPDVKRYAREFHVRGMSFHLKPDALEFSSESPPIMTLPTPDSADEVARWNADQLEWEPTDSETVPAGLAAAVEVLGEYVTVTEDRALAISDIRVEPNPFSPDLRSVTISYELTSNDARMPFVSVRVYNMAAQLVREIVSNEPQGKGRSEVQWDGMTGSGSGRSLTTARNGRYVIEIEVKDSTGKQSALATVVLVK